MTTISDTLIGPDGSADWDEGSTIRFEADEPRDVGGKILTTRPEPVPVNTDGTFSATLQPGRYTVRVRSGNSLREQMGPWPIVVPATGTSRLWPLIAVAVGQSPDISYQRLLAAVQAYLEANPIEGGGGGGLTEQQIATAATTPGAPIKTALDTTYAPLWQADTAYPAGARVINPTGDIVTAKAAFTSGASYSAANWNLVRAALVPDGITYNPDGTVASSTSGGITTAYTWNADGTVNTETSQGLRKTWTYTNGLPTSSTVTAV
ncbi:MULTISPECIES: hypothetical protein [unclassified Rhodococcus (in: high G+C Gram-positive bacteria)]|uniref:hypothetical protein n=1 Tax=unclassified Rhodococcus (in: high G+C Gram-positive bacteria) TaxID=192944 RepID=UPI0006FC438F|nr:MULTISPECIES: hypothetical protein [unclassified Rhodococcus (in: high G+C Gram-positive bacteria)]KQU30356.1 hypothetical protein ASG69_04680 [Rhodococcus sp. Leaf225]KQU44739.1 hypothetical protein ASH03_12460 [Rhodococcus sp. Leaf258]